MDAAARHRPANRRLVAGAVNVNVARVRIDVAAAVEPRFESFQPQNARGDFCVRHPLPGITDGLAPLEHRSHRPAATNFFHDAMQSERRAVRAGGLADAKAGSGTAKIFGESKFFRSGSRQRAEKCGGPPTAATQRGIFKKRNGLFGDADNENKARWNDAVFFAGAEKNF